MMTSRGNNPDGVNRINRFACSQKLWFYWGIGISFGVDRNEKSFANQFIVMIPEPSFVDDLALVAN